MLFQKKETKEKKKKKSAARLIQKYMYKSDASYLESKNEQEQ